jgi:hypothetical protein
MHIHARRNDQPADVRGQLRGLIAGVYARIWHCVHNCIDTGRQLAGISELSGYATCRKKSRA